MAHGTQDLNQVPPNLEVWQVGSQLYLVRRVTEFGVEPPIFLYWSISEADKEALGITTIDHRFDTERVFARTGALNMGDSRELVNTTEDPVDQVLSAYETEVRVKPWLADPEILSLWIGAALEGRGITEAELHGTEWWRSHSRTERAWLSLNASDPTTADNLIADNRARVAQLFADAGVDNASADLINLVADKWTTGSWTEVYATNQIRLLADPFLEGDLDPDLADSRSGLDTTREREDEVRSLISRWLGPQLAGYYDDTFIGTWASRLRENPDARVELEDFLRRQFQTHINVTRDGERVYGDDAALTYDDVAGPWRGLWQQTWGQLPDESDELFLRLVRTNDLATASRLLREEGLKRGNATVAQNLLSDLDSAFGGQIRRADPAIL